MQEADWEVYKKRREVDARLYEIKQDAKAKKARAEADFFAQQRAADAELYRKEREAEGICAIARAEGLYLNTLMKELGGNYAALRDYLINRNMYQEIGKINAEAMNDMQSEISIWSNGKDGQEAIGNGGMKDMAQIYTMLPPLMKTVNEQTGISFADWHIATRA